MSESADFRLRRIEKLLHELEYEITRGVMEREIEPDLHMSKIFPCAGRGDGLALLEVHLSPTHKYSSHAYNVRPMLRIVKNDDDKVAGEHR